MKRLSAAPFRTLDPETASSGPRDVSGTGAKPANADKEPSGRLVAIACILGAIFVIGFWNNTILSSYGVRDFTGFLIGAKLLGTSQIYDIPANLVLQKSMTGATEQGIIFVQPPFVALAMKPFTLMPYPLMLDLWKALLILALVTFCCILPLVPKRCATLAICWSIPAGEAIGMGNDTPLVLLLVALSIFCWKRHRKVLAGVMLGLCLAKFHFLAFLPILLFRRENRRILAGFAAIAAALIAVNFAVQPDWLPLYWKALHMPESSMNARATLMPNFYASFFWTGHPSVGVAIGAVLVAAALWRARRLPFELALPLFILGGLLASPHTNSCDAILGIPALLLIAREFPRLAILLLSPLAALSFSALLPGWGAAMFLCGCLSGLFAFTSRHTRRLRACPSV